MLNMFDFKSSLEKKVFIVAELSANHVGNIDIAKDTIKAAKDAGADAIKFQTYTPDTLTIRSKKKDFIINNNSIWDGKTYYDLYEIAHTPWEWHKELFDVAKKEKIVSFSSPFDKTAVDFLEKLGNPIYKIASFEITDIPLIEYTARKNKPIVLSTGISREDDIKLAIKTIKDVGNDQIILLKCTSGYPSPLNEANLRMIKWMSEKFKLPVGLSDHSIGIVSPIVAVAMGAVMIEKHIILDKKLGGPDSSFSLDKDEFKIMVDNVRDAERTLGVNNFSLTKKQLEGRKFSRSLYVTEDILKGETFTDKNVKSIRPGFGLHPSNLNIILGKKANKNLSKGDRFKLDYIKD